MERIPSLNGRLRPALNPRRGRILAAALLLLAPAGPRAVAHAQQVELGGELVDRVVAEVGDSAILLSQVVQRENQERARGIQVPPPGTPASEDFRTALIEGLIDDMVLLQAAARDTMLQVEDAEVEAALTAQMDTIEARYIDRAAMIEDMRREGLTLQSFREMMRTQIAQQRLIELYVRTRTGEGEVAVEVSEEEVRAAFEAGRANLQQRPATVTFEQVVMEVRASDSVRAEARAALEELRERALAGEDFAELAVAHSQDPSAASGGDLGWFRKGRFLPEFEDAAFTLLEGAVSDIIETVYGFHIIQVERIRPQERKARHILIRPQAGPADRNRVRELAEEVAERAKTEDFRALIEEHHDSAEPDSGTVAERQVASVLPAAYLAPLTTAQPGDVEGPIRFATRAGRDAFTVLRIIRRTPAGEYTFEEFEPQLRASIASQKRIRTHVDGLRAKTYIEIKGS